MANVPCQSGKCGVQNHIAGSAEHQRCIQRNNSRRENAAAIHSGPYLATSSDKYKAYCTDLRDRLQERSDAYQMYLDRYDKAETPVVRAKRWAMRKLNMIGSRTSTPDQHAALQHYLAGNHDRGIQETFAGLMHQAKNQPPTDSSGHNVKPLSKEYDGVRVEFSAVNYYHEESKSPVILATETTFPKDGGEPIRDYLRVEYEIEGPMRNVIDPRTSEVLDRAGYSSDSLHLTGYMRPESRRVHSLIDLLIHTQDPENQED